MAVSSSRSSSVSSASRLTGPNSLVVEQAIVPAGGNPLDHAVGATARALRLAALLCTGTNALPGTQPAPPPTASQGRWVGSLWQGGNSGSSPHLLTLPPVSVKREGDSGDVEITRSDREALAALVRSCDQARVERQYPRAATHLTDAIALICNGGPLFPVEDVDGVRSAGTALRAAVSEALRHRRNDQGLADCMTLVAGVMEKFAERYGQTR